MLSLQKQRYRLKVISLLKVSLKIYNSSLRGSGISYVRRVPLVRDWVARVGSVFLYVGTSTSTPVVIDGLYAAFLDIACSVSS